jgi:hypothetical protein
MADAVIIDDGGSTRIKQMKGDVADGKMDDLISDKADRAKGKFDRLRVVFIDGDGEAHGPIDTPLNPNDAFEIRSGNQQKILGKLDNAQKLDLSLESDCEDLESLVDAKQHKQQRRYVVSNAGAILTVSINNAAPVFDAETNAVHKTSVYTMVILRQKV